MRPSLKPTVAATDSMPIAHEPLVSVIIPTLDEAESLGQIISAVRAGDVLCEILVVEPGSSDDTAKIAAAAGARVIHSVRRRQRARRSFRWRRRVYTPLCFPITSAPRDLSPRAVSQPRDRLASWGPGDVRSAFQILQLGGFREVDQFEDLDLSRRLRKFGRTVTLRAHVTS